jgi:hypothetical protein
MAEITAAAVMALREKTGLPMMECKKALTECGGNTDQAVEWLRKQGVQGLRPIHTLRKEIGAVIASRDGIWKASRYLRHSDIRITSRLYADKKIPVTSGLAAFFAPVADNVVSASFNAPATGVKATKLKKRP